MSRLKTPVIVKTPPKQSLSGAPLEFNQKLPAQFLEEQADGLDPAVEVRNVELLVGSVQVVIRQAEAHHHRWNLQHVLKIGHDWNRTARADEHGIFLKYVE